jgi:hypothetical protein
MCYKWSLSPTKLNVHHYCLPYMPHTPPTSFFFRHNMTMITNSKTIEQKYKITLSCLVFYCVLCTLYCVLCTMHCVLCTMYCVLCTVHCVLCTVHCVLCTVYSILLNFLHPPESDLLTLKMKAVSSSELLEQAFTTGYEHPK